METNKMQLIDEKFKIVFNSITDAPDFKVMNGFVSWCDSYVRHFILHFEFLKDCTNYSVFFVRDKQLQEYISEIQVYIRKPSHRLEWEDKKIKEFKDFVLKKFKKAKPEVKDWIIEEELNSDKLEAWHSSQAVLGILPNFI
jgi:hypothetical protein